MGTQKSEAQLFSYAVNLAKRVRANHPLRLTISESSRCPMADTWPWPHSSPIPPPMMTRGMRSLPAWPKPPGIAPTRRADEALAAALALDVRFAGRELYGGRPRAVASWSREAGAPVLVKTDRPHRCARARGGAHGQLPGGEGALGQGKEGRQEVM